MQENNYVHWVHWSWPLPDYAYFCDVTRDYYALGHIDELKMAMELAEVTCPKCIASLVPIMMAQRFRWVGDGYDYDD